MIVKNDPVTIVHLGGISSAQVPPNDRQALAQLSHDSVKVPDQRSWARASFTRPFVVAADDDDDQHNGRAGSRRIALVANPFDRSRAALSASYGLPELTDTQKEIAQNFGWDDEKIERFRKHLKDRPRSPFGGLQDAPDLTERR